MVGELEPAKELTKAMYQSVGWKGALIFVIFVIACYYFWFKKLKDKFS